MNRSIALTVAFAFTVLGSHREICAQGDAKGLQPVLNLADGSFLLPLKFEKKLDQASFGIIALYEYEGDGLIVHGKTEYAVQLPDVSPEEKLAYGFVYFTGWPNGTLDSTHLVLVEGYDGDEPRFFLDLNNNLDLSDDASAVEREGDSDQYILTFHARDHPERKFPVRTIFVGKRQVYVDDPTRLKGIEQAFGPIQARNGGKGLGAEFWLSDKRLNILSADVKHAGLKFQIGVHDWDCNGAYNDEGVDMILSGEYGGEFLSTSRVRGATKLEAKALIQLAGQAFEVLEVDPAGKHIRLIASDRPYTRISEGTQLPSFELDRLAGEGLTIEDLLDDGRYLLIDFWAHWCKPCVMGLPEVKRLEGEYPDQLTVLSLHRGDHAAGMALIEEHNLDWLHAKATDVLVETFMVDSWPTFILVDPQGKILEFGTSVAEVRRRLDAVRKSHGKDLPGPRIR